MEELAATFNTSVALDGTTSPSPEGAASLDSTSAAGGTNNPFAVASRLVSNLRRNSLSSE